MPIQTIAKVTERHKKSIYSVIKGKAKFAKRGPKEKLSRKDVTNLVRILRSMIKKAKARYEVTLTMLKKRAKCKVSDKVVRKALKTRKIAFRKMRSKPLLTTQDRKARLAFAKKYMRKTREWWLEHIDQHWDIKNFMVYTHAAARAVAAMREVRGAYRAPGQGLDEAYVVIPKDMRYNPGAKSVRIAGAVGGGKVRLWHEVGKRWSGAVAAKLYKGPLASALKAQRPDKTTWKVLEDNDPTGFKSNEGKAAKRAAKIGIFEIPKRSPDLNVLDYAIWKQVTRKMRAQEKKFPKSKRETRAEYIARLRKVAKRLPASFINKAIGNMVTRCRRLYDAQGGHFEEGGC